MKNFEKYKMTEDRLDAFHSFCDVYAGGCDCTRCPISKENMCDCVPTRGFAFWLDLEVEEEKPLPCPFCGAEVKVGEIDNDNKEAVEFYIHCDWCHITTMDFATRGELLSMWNNRLAKAVMDGKAKETNK